MQRIVPIRNKVAWWNAEAIVCHTMLQLLSRENQSIMLDERKIEKKKMAHFIYVQTCNILECSFDYNSFYK